MSNSHAAALSAGPLLRLQIGGRTLNSAGVAALAVALAMFLCLTLPVQQRTVFGLLASAAMIAGGDLLSQRGTNRQRWCGTSIMGTGYLLAAFFAHASYYVADVAALDSPWLCWLLELSLAAVAAVHASRHPILRWLSVPFTTALTANVLLRALYSPDALNLLGFNLPVSALASVAGTLWLAALSGLYKRVEERFSAAEAWQPSMVYRLAHEAYFVLTAVSALALPKFCHSLEYAPIWWALETPALLWLSWPSKSFVKHALVMSIWVVSAGLVLLPGLPLVQWARMAVPLSGLSIALIYRFVTSDWARWQKLTGYALYLYGGAAVAVAVPLLQLGPEQALPYFLVEAAMLLALALSLQDRVLHGLGSLAGVAALALFAAHWHQWGYVTPTMVVVGCYGFSLLYGYISKRGGWPNSDFALLPGPLSVSAKEAGWLEIGLGTAGYLTLMAASCLLLPYPANTITWGVAALLLIVFGFAVDKVGHRFSGVVGIFAACAKLWIVDLSGAGAGVRSLVGFTSVGVCLITAGTFYLVEYVIKAKKPATGNGTTPDADDQP